MLVELEVIEQRYRAVREVLDGVAVTEVARRFGVARQTVHTWLCRYAAAGGIANLAGSVVAADLVSASDACGGRGAGGGGADGASGVGAVADPVPAGPGAGGAVPGRSSVYRAQVRHGLIDPVKRKRRRSDYRRWERGRAMELWQMDVMGGAHLADRSECKVVTGIDDHSRFVVCAKIVARATAAGA